MDATKETTKAIPEIMRVAPKASLLLMVFSSVWKRGPTTWKLTVDPSLATLNWSPKTMLSEPPLNQEDA